MTWVIRAAPGAERLMEYESQLNRFTRDYDDSAMCLYYERSRFPPEAILGVIRRGHHELAKLLRRKRYRSVDGPLLRGLGVRQPGGLCQKLTYYFHQER